MNDVMERLIVEMKWSRRPFGKEVSCLLGTPMRRSVLNCGFYGAYVFR